jgi:hypothetical protein
MDLVMSARLTIGVNLGEYASSILSQVKWFGEFDRAEGSDRHEKVHIGVEPFLLAFAMELALKAWFVFDHDNPKPPRTHNLVKLFKRLELDSQLRLERAFEGSVASLHPVNFLGSVGMKGFLEQHANAFVEWRYPHERKHPMQFQISAFVATLEMVLSEFRTRYHIQEAWPPLSAVPLPPETR